MTDPSWLTPEQETAWIRFAAVLELLPGVLDTQLSRDEGLTHFDYVTLAMLSESSERTLRMTDLAARTHATLPRLSRVVTRLESSGFLARTPSPTDRRATHVTLTAAGWDKVVAAAPGHVDTVRSMVIDTLTPAQVRQLSTIAQQLMTRLDPDGRVFVTDRSPG